MSTRTALQARWDALADRERRLLAGAGALIVVALVWWVALAPALATLRAASVQNPQLDAQLQQMQVLKAQALALQSQPKMAADEALRILEGLVKQRLAGTAQMAVVGERVTVTLKGTNADALAQWLVQARTNARAVPTEVRLTKFDVKNATTNAITNSTAAWDGIVVLALPAR